MRKFIVSALSLGVLSSSIVILSCGGGGGGGGDKDVPSSPTVQSYSSEVGVSVEPQAGTDNLQAQSFKLRKLQTNTEFRIEVVSSDSSGKLIEKKVITANPQKPVSVKVKLSNNGGSVTVSATADGYNKATKSFRYNDPKEVKTISVKLTPIPVKTQVVNIDEGLTISSTGQKYVRFAFFRDAKGITKLAVGESEISKQSNAQKLIDVVIPLSKLQSDVEALKVQYRDFSPSNPNDYRNFPSEQTADGKKLVSFGFDYLVITDQDGNNPFVNQSSQGLSTTRVEGEYYRILRYVDCNQINEMKESGILQDEDPNKEGIQFTFYAFDRDQGGWVEAGQGVFVSKSDISYEDIGDDPNSVDTVWDYIIQNGCVNDDPCFQNPDSTACVDVNNDGTPEDVSCSGNSVITDITNICKDGSGWVVISVTNPEFEWKNLDYVVPEGNQKCCSFQIVDESGNPVSGAYAYVNPSENSDIEWTEGVADEEGNVTLCTLSYGNNLSGELWISNPYTWEFTQSSIDFNNCPKTITLENPYKCTAEGKVVNEEGNPVSGAYVEIYDANYFIYRWGYTDENGAYSINVPCNTDLSLTVNWSGTVYSLNVNNSKGTNEKDDDGQKVVLKDFTLQNNPPEGFAYAWDYTVKAGGTVNITVCAWDWEGDYPITYQISPSEGTVNPSDGQIDSDEWCEDVTYTAPNNQQDVTINVTFRDNAGKESSEVLNITVTSENSPPVGYLYGSVSYDGTNYVYDIYAYFYDEDGDEINWSISSNCDVTLTSGTDSGSADGWGEAIVTYTTSTNGCEFTLSLNGNDVETLTLRYQNLEPEVYLWVNEGVYVSQKKSSATVYAYVYDDDDPNGWTCRWTVNDAVDSNATSCDTYTLDLSNANPGDSYSVELCVTDPAGNRGCGSITIYYGGSGSADIVIQNK